MHSGGGGFSLSKLTSVLKKKTQSDFDRVIGKPQNQREIVDMIEILGLWRLEDLDDTLDDLEETRCYRFWTKDGGKSFRYHPRARGRRED